MTKFRLGTTDRHLDADAVDDGVRLECPLRPGLFVTITPAASYNRAYRAALSDWRERWDGSKDAKPSDDLGKWYESAEVVARGIVRDMDPIFEDGEPVEYTPELGVEILSDRSQADVLTWIADMSVTSAHFFNRAMEADAGN